MLLQPVNEPLICTPEGQRLVLRFLRDEIYSSVDIIQEVLQTSEHGARGVLEPLARAKLIRYGSVLKDGQLIELCGITLQGQMQAADPTAEETCIERVFRPSSVRVAKLNHTLYVQRARVRALRGPYLQWLNEKAIGASRLNIPMPDALAHDAQGRRVAVEVELTTKSKARYAHILYARLRAIRLKMFDRVTWVTVTQREAILLESKIKSITKVPVVLDGLTSWVPIKPEMHHRVLSFSSFETWPY